MSVIQAEDYPFHDPCDEGGHVVASSYKHLYRITRKIMWSATQKLRVSFLLGLLFRVHVVSAGEIEFRNVHPLKGLSDKRIRFDIVSAYIDCLSNRVMDDKKAPLLISP
jgi:hypothetical protein